jgi:DNA-nicking Smr family endonuclease
MTRRRLRPDELTLWQEVARKTTPLSSNRKLPATSSTDQPAQQARPPRQEPETPPKFEIGQTARDRNGGHDVLPPLPEGLQQAPVSMDKKAFQRLKKGKLVPEAKLDLHGMTLDQAHPALNGFILRSHAAGRRLVLIVTGKGRDRDPGDAVPIRRGVLRHSVPQWLRMAPLSSLVLQITEAHLKHGGGGAYYVYLRRRR